MTRSIAEIVGFSAPHEFRFHECLWCATIEGTEVTEACWDNPTEPTADDLLAWLREQGWQTHTASGVLDARTHCYLTKWAGTEVVEVGFHTTLLAALEQAVRAVAGES